MTPRDLSQVPVEQLARLLLDRARNDSGLPRRTAANSNEAPPGWRAPEPAPPCSPWFPERLAEQPRFAGQDRIADLVSQAITAAQEAEGIALATRDASRRANRGAAIAMALGTFGAVIGIGAGAAGLLCRDAKLPESIAAHSVASLSAVVPAVSLASQRGIAPSAGVQEDSTAASPPKLAPARFVRMLPAVPSPPQTPPPPRRLPRNAGFGRVIGSLLRQRAG